jgi:hypothetical protein
MVSAENLDNNPCDNEITASDTLVLPNNGIPLADNYQPELPAAANSTALSLPLLFTLVVCLFALHTLTING